MADQWEAIDVNSRGSLTAVSYLDDKTIVRLTADPVTGALLVSETSIFSAVYYNETPTGLVNGINTTFTLAHTPALNSLVLTIARQPQILGVDYTISGNTITYLSAPASGLTPHNAIYAASAGVIQGTVYVETPGGLINGSNVTYSTVNVINTIISLTLNGEAITPDQYTYTVGVEGFTMDTAIPAPFSGLSFYIVYV